MTTLDDYKAKLREIILMNDPLDCHSDKTTRDLAKQQLALIKALEIYKDYDSETVQHMDRAHNN